ncbi:MAG: Gfo/Idh/MocA family oxidoreductase [bacterium]
MKKTRVAVIGVGHLGQHHARILANHERCTLAAVCDVNKKIANQIAKTYGTQAVFDHKLLLGHVDAVSIAVPTISHFEIAKAFLEDNVHVLVEKPITPTVEEAQELVNIARDHKRVLQVGHIERFNAAIMKLNEILNEPQFIEIHRLGPYDPRVKDIGVVLDLMIHDLDIVLQIVRSPVQSIDAVGVGVLSDKEDIANARLKFASGCTANLTVSRITPVKKRKLRVFQKDAYIAIDYADQSMEIYRKVDVPNPKAGQPAAEIVRTKVRLKKEEPLKVELDHFIDCVEKGIEPTVTGQHGANALQLAVTISQLIAKNLPYGR